MPQVIDDVSVLTQLSRGMKSVLMSSAVILMITCHTDMKAVSVSEPKTTKRISGTGLF